LKAFSRIKYFFYTEEKEKGKEQEKKSNMNPKETCCSYQTNRTNAKNTSISKNWNTNWKKLYLYETSGSTSIYLERICV